MNYKYPLAKETINNDDIDALIEWLKTYPKLTKDKLTIEFEQKLAEWIGVKYSVFVNSGSSANLLMIYALIVTGKLRVGDNVIVPAVSWATTISPIIQFGLIPIMCGADKDTYGINLEQYEELCKLRNPKACIFVQVLGVPHKRQIREISDKYGVILLEDACAAQGSRYEDGLKVGALGDISTYSFYAGHNSSTIEGGSIHTNDYELYKTLLMLRSHGWAKDLPKKDYVDIMNKYNIDTFHSPFAFIITGFNVRSTDLQAFIGLKQIEKFDYNFGRRNSNHICYADKLKDIVEYQDWKNDYPVSISFGCVAKNTEERKKIVQSLSDNNIECRLFSAGNIGKHPMWTNLYGEFNDVIANKIHSCGFFLPNFPELECEDINFISNIVKQSILN